MIILLTLLSSVLIRSTSACGETFENRFGNFSLLDHTVNCNWTIRGPPGSNISIFFMNALMRSNTDCTYQYLQILDANGDEIWKKCRAMNREVHDFPEHMITINYGAISNIHRSTNVFAIYYIHYSDDKCGGLIYANDPEGKLSSPTENGLMLTNVNCLWILMNRDRGRRLYFAFRFMELEMNNGSCEDSVQVFDGFPVSDPIGTYCGNIPPDVIRVHYILSVNLTSDNDNPFRGFTALHFCESLVSNPENRLYLSSPVGTLEADAIKKYDVGWVIIGGEDATLKVVFTRFTLREPDCETCVEFRLGHLKSSSPVVGLSTVDIGTVYEFDSSTVTISFRPALFNFGNGFSLTYYMGKNDTCGGLFRSSTGSLSFPGAGQNYDNMMVCDWVFVALPGETITFEILTNDMNASCTSDSLKVYDLMASSSPMLLEVCGASIGTEVSTTNQLHLVFESDAVDTYNGFTSKWTIETDGCGGIFHTQSGTFNSANRTPGEALHCEWRIIVSNDQYIELNFTNFDLLSNTDCDIDYVEIRSDDTADANLLLRTCDFNISRSFWSISHQLYIIYHSSTPSNGTGVAASYSAASISCVKRIQALSANFSWSAGGEEVCIWMFGEEPFRNASVVFDTFNLHSSVDCNDEFIEIYDRNGTNILRTCGTDPPSIIRGTWVMVFFRSHIKSSASFSGVFYRSFEKCGSLEVSEHGIIVPPKGDDGHILFATVCNWVIHGRPGQRVVIYVSHMRNEDINLELDDGLYDNSGEVFDIENAEIPPVFISTGNNLFLRYDNGAHEGDFVGGFVAHYEIIDEPPEKEILLNETNMISLRREVSNGTIHREWHIVGPPEAKFTVYFTKFFLDTSHDCDVDYLEIRNGWRASSPLIERSCDFSIGTFYEYNITEAYIIFHSENISRGEGFTLFYHMDDCGGLIVLPEGNMTYPTNGEAFGVLETCSWLFVGFPMMSITFDMTKKVIGTLSYEKTSIKIFDGASERDPLLTTMKALTPLAQGVHSSSNYLAMYFESSYSAVPFGSFAGRWFIEQEGCGNVFIEPSGEFSSDVKNGTEDLRCEWLIMGKFDSLIELNFTEYDLGANCAESYVEIRNGDEPDSPLVTTLCSTSTDRNFTVANHVFMVYYSSQTSGGTGIAVSYAIYYNVDECTAGSDTCHANANCTNTDRSYTCTCLDGYNGDGQTCDDVDECTAGSFTCDANAECTNTDGSYECTCLDGYNGNGQTCDDVDECTAGSFTCDANAECTNTDGSYTCTCLDGYNGNGQTCDEESTTSATTVSKHGKMGRSKKHGIVQEVLIKIKT